MADKLVALAIEGDVQALREIGDRLDGKPHQSVSGLDGGAIEIALIRRVIVKPT